MEKITRICSVIFIIFLTVPGTGRGTDQEFYELEAGFKNFIQCEFTRADTEKYFKEKDFAVIMVNFFNVTREMDITILTGTVKCDVQGQYRTLYVAMGLRDLKGKKVVSYFTIRHKDFHILATELIRYPYKERCPWARYWINQDYPNLAPEKDRNIAALTQFAYALASMSGIGKNGDGSGASLESTWIAGQSGLPLFKKEIQEMVVKEIQASLEEKSESITGIAPQKKEMVSESAKLKPTRLKQDFLPGYVHCFIEKKF